MMALVRGRSQRSSSTGVAVRSSHARSTTRNHLSSRTATLPRCGNGATLALGSRGHSAGGHDHDLLERRILIALAPSGAHTRDLVDDLHALRDAAKDRVPDVALEVLERDGRFLREQLHHEGAVRSLESDHEACPSVTRSWPARSGCERT